jgi:hypothetical protein
MSSGGCFLMGEEVSTQKTQKSQPGFSVSLAIGWDATVVTLPA